VVSARSRKLSSFDEEEMTEDIVRNRVKDTTRRIDGLQKHYKEPANWPDDYRPSQQKESTRIPPLPMGPGPRDRSVFADHPQPRFH